MTPLNKFLIFYLKYPREMHVLYDQFEYERRKGAFNDGDPDLTGLPNAERVREMARAVGAAAEQEVAAILEECGNKIESHFTNLGAPCTEIKQRPFILRDWLWRVRVGVPRVHGWFKCGIGLRAQEGTLVPWLWHRGGPAWEERVMARLRDRPQLQAGGGLVRENGAVGLGHFPKRTVILGCFPICAKNQSWEDVDRDALIDKVVRAFAAIGVEDLPAIAGNVGEADAEEE